MKIKKLHIENFRSILSLDLDLDETTVFIGANNSGKSAILESIRIALSRRWGIRGTGFTEDDVHREKDDIDPRVAPPVKIRFEFEEETAGEWPEDMIANLDDIMTLSPEGLNRIAFSITYTWNPDKEIFEPAWEFLNPAGEPLPPKRRSINLSGFYDYILFLWLGALRDIDDEFNSRSRNWGGLLRMVKIPPELEKEIKETLDKLDTKLLGADPKLSKIAETIGHATEIAIEEKPGSAKLRMLPMNIWDLLSRAGVILQNEDLRPWLPLNHHGQGLQSLSIIFLLQASVSQQLSEGFPEGTEPIFAIEEPEAHLHPQAVRTLWQKISDLPGQKLVTTHSPYFVQNIPLLNLRLVKYKNGSSHTTCLPKKIISEIPYKGEVQKVIDGKKWRCFSKDSSSGNVLATQSFGNDIAEELIKRLDSTLGNKKAKASVLKFHRDSRILISPDEESELTLLGKRIRGEMFFAKKWILVEGPSEYLLLHALGKSLGYDLDQHGVAVIDFQNNGNASIYPALADAFGIFWYMITDGDHESEKFHNQLLNRGFSEKDLSDHFDTLPKPNDLEDQLTADGHETLLRNILKEFYGQAVVTCSQDEFKKRLKNKKTFYMTRLAPLIASDQKLASKMPKNFTSLIENLKSSSHD